MILTTCLCAALAANVVLLARLWGKTPVPPADAEFVALLDKNEAVPVHRELAKDYEYFRQVTGWDSPKSIGREIGDILRENATLKRQNESLQEEVGDLQEELAEQITEGFVKDGYTAGTTVSVGPTDLFGESVTTLIEEARKKRDKEWAAFSDPRLGIPVDDLFSGLTLQHGGTGGSVTYSLTGPNLGIPAGDHLLVADAPVNLGDIVGINGVGGVVPSWSQASQIVGVALESAKTGDAVRVRVCDQVAPGQSYPGVKCSDGQTRFFDAATTGVAEVNGGTKAGDALYRSPATQRLCPNRGVWGYTTVAYALEDARPQVGTTVARVAFV